MNFDEFWENYPAFAPWGVAEPSDATKILAKCAWDKALESAVQTCKDWTLSIFPKGEDIDHETAEQIANGVPRDLADAIENLKAR